MQAIVSVEIEEWIKGWNRRTESRDGMRTCGTERGAKKFHLEKKNSLDLEFVSVLVNK